MYAIGSREELENLIRMLQANQKLLLFFIREGDTEKALELAELDGLITAMLQDAVKDHFNGRN